MNLLEQVAMSPLSSYCIIQLTKGQYAIIDAADYPLVRGRKWHSEWNSHTQSYYAKSSKYGGLVDGKKKIITTRMHRLILGLTDWHITADHINPAATLDNRRYNLREATRTQNRRNSRIQKNNTSGFKGVYKSRFGKPWYAMICVDRKLIKLGSFDTIEEAAESYEKASLLYHKEFGRVT